jgi:DNA (cytosine-5)-methyltransferase 1
VTRPLLLDAFCGAGGAAVGYQRAGFDVVGVDHLPQPNYPFRFIQADALEYLAEHGREFDTIHASPPCHAYSSVTGRNRQRYPDLIAPTRELLQASELPYVIENVPGAPLVNAVQLCGSSFGLNVRRHRLFECSFPLNALVPPCAHHWQRPRFRSLDSQQKTLASVVGVHGHLNYAGEDVLREQAMGIDWMATDELTQAIPPAYAEYIGTFLLAATRRAA